MKYTVIMHKLDSLTDLSHEHNTRFLCQDEVIIDHSLKQFTTRYPENKHTNYKMCLLNTDVLVISCDPQQICIDKRYLQLNLC